MTQPIKVIFIQSRGHSGSTLLELLLGAHSQVLPVGELKTVFPKQLLMNGRPNKLQNCCCGTEVILDCPFWSQVDHELSQKHRKGLVSLDILSDDPDTFNQDNLALFQALSHVSEQQVIVDSSKRLDRLLRLNSIRELQIFPIHLQRAPLGNIYSQMRKGEHWLQATYRYTKSVTNTYRKLQVVEHYPLRYEKLVRNPQAALRELMNWVGLDFEESQLLWSDQAHHRIGGNERVRALCDNTIIEDQEWQTKLSLSQKMGILGLTLPVRFPNSPLWELEKFFLGRWLKK